MLGQTAASPDLAPADYALIPSWAQSHFRDCLMGVARRDAEIQAESWQPIH